MHFEQGALTPCFELQSQNATENPSSATKEGKPVNWSQPGHCGMIRQWSFTCTSPRKP